MKKIIFAIILALRYWVQIVLSAVCAATENRFVKSVFVGMCLALITFFIAPTVIANVTIPSSISSVLATIYQNASISGASFLVILWVFIFAVSLLYQPAKLNKDKLDEIKVLRDKIEPVVAIRIEEDNDDAILGRVGVKIYNDTPNKIIDLQVELIHNGLVEKNVDGGDKIIVIPSDANRFHVDDRTIEHFGHRFICIAYVDNKNRVSFALENPIMLYDFSVWDLDVDVAVIVKARMEIDGHSRFTNSPSFRGHVNFEKEIPTAYDDEKHEWIPGKPMSITITEIPNDQKETDQKANSAP